MNWVYGESDPALMLFTAARARFGFDIPANATVLELGCAETDFLERLHRQNPDMQITGVDAREEPHRSSEGVTIRQGSAIDADLFAAESFDWVVMLGALEHFGLGFYGDPIDEDGDTKTMRNVARWLKPGGFVYFDVPYQPHYEVAENRHFRMYAPASIRQRLLFPAGLNHNGSGPFGYERGVPCTILPWQLEERARGYSEPEPTAGTWVDEPTAKRVPYWYVAVLAQKVT